MVLVLIGFCAGWMQYNLDFRGLSPRGRSPRGDDDSAISGTEGGKSSGGAGGDPSIWQFGMARRGKGDSRRTRVSFLLFWVTFDGIGIHQQQLTSSLSNIFNCCNIFSCTALWSGHYLFFFVSFLVDATRSYWHVSHQLPAAHHHQLEHHHQPICTFVSIEINQQSSTIRRNMFTNKTFSPKINRNLHNLPHKTYQIQPKSRQRCAYAGPLVTNMIDRSYPIKATLKATSVYHSILFFFSFRLILYSIISMIIIHFERIESFNRVDYLFVSLSSLFVYPLTPLPTPFVKT